MLCSFILFLSSLTWSRTAGSFLVYPVFVGSDPIFRLQVLFFPSRCLFLSHVVRAYPRSNPRCVFWQTSYPKWSLAPQQIVQQSRTFLDGGVLGPLGSLRSASCQQPQLMALYLLSVLQASTSPAPVQSALYNNRWAHDLTGFQSPMIHKLPQKVLESARRRLSHQKSKKSPMTTEILLKSFQSLNGFLVDTRFMDMALLAYAGFLRLDKLSNLRLKDVTPDPAYFELFIESSKTDQYVRVSLYHVVKTGADLCRWANLVNYASQPKLILPTSLNGGDDFLFGNIQTKSGTHFVRVGSKISCTTCREVLSKHLVDLGLQL